MSKGSLPLPYIVALIFAVIVIAVVGYLFFSGVWQFPPTAKQEWCNAQKLKYCYDWQQAGKEPGWESYAPGCKEIGIDKPDKEVCEKLGIKIP
ncbi:MAG: hypothetical protein QMD12_02710 [Candidatus Aenigmarchaeota archaeon]|nr:hypothetical protein [Candidatus Aenigmarchaeota archaeon]